DVAISLAVQITVDELADLIDGQRLRGDGSHVLTGFAALDVAGPNDISFFGNAKYAGQLAATKAGAVMLADASVEAPEDTALLLVENPVIAFDVIVRRYGVAKLVGDAVTLDAGKVSVGANAVIADGSVIGDGSRIGAGVVVGEKAVIGEDCEISPNVSIREGTVIGDRVIIHSGAVIGADGYGFEFANGRHGKIEQLGIVRIDSDVEIGANTTIDRARFGETVVGEGTKIDNQVQIGHNVVIGKHCLIVAQVGIAGSTVLGDYVTLAARAGIGGHLKLGSKSTVGGKSGLITDLPEGETYFGYPAKPMKEDLRMQMRIKQL
ncbi:UNVERIFIED_CONTAM: hypothetical protein GTU68_060795, partial [Idotea baltica]|nr:hypothetical protein [Idotea baltica]